MKHPLLTAGTALLLGLNVPGGLVLGADSAEEAESNRVQADLPPGHELLRVTQEMWFLLSGIMDRAGAEAAAPKLAALMAEAEIIGNKLYDEESNAQDLEALDMLHYRIAEALDDLNSELTSLSRLHCYGSEALITQFYHGVELGLIAEEVTEGLVIPRPPLTESEARREVGRLRLLEEPDRRLLQVLQAVKDVSSANKAVERLKLVAVRLKELQPQKELTGRAFSSSSLRHAREAYAPVEPLLWGIRTEIVRIAGLPGYDEADYDSFSDALDTVYESLGATHSTWFAEVFDESFRTDLDEALHENATTSN